jgi:hypothetical protein
MIKRLVDRIDWFLVLELLALPMLLLFALKNGALSDYVLLITYAAVVWYAEETREMRKEMQKQNQVELAPFLVLGWAPYDSRFPQKIYIKNMGRGIAINVCIHRIPEFERRGDWQFNYSFNPITAIMPHDNAGVSVMYKSKTEIIGDATKGVSLNTVGPGEEDFYMNPAALVTYDLVVTYQDVLGGSYKTRIMADRDYNQRYKVVEYISPLRQTGVSL